MVWAWLSFRDPDTNTNLGCCNVEVSEFSVIEAAEKAWDLGINPGGKLFV